MAVPEEPKGIEYELEITPLYEMAIVLFEMFTAFTQSGFTEQQALRLVAFMAEAESEAEQEEEDE